MTTAPPAHNPDSGRAHPNILLILLHDMGFGASSAFGSPGGCHSEGVADAPPPASVPGRWHRPGRHGLRDASFGRSRCIRSAIKASHHAKELERYLDARAEIVWRTLYM
jgi:hypothetical protein